MAGEAGVNGSQVRWEAHRRLFEEYLHGLRFTEETRLEGLEGAMRYSMLAGGKRVRPTLCMEVAWIFGAEPSLVLPSAAAIELIHTYSLIHDDLPAMDDDDYRRGMPTAHKKFGEAMAILAGDAFFGEALTLITVHQEGSCEQILDVVRELADSTGVNGMVGGQIMDMDQTGQGEITDPETLYMIHKYKTGALIKSSARIGAILAGANREEQVAVSEYASELGLCFQIVDDVLERHLDERGAGKERRFRRRAGQGDVRGRVRTRRCHEGGRRCREEGSRGAFHGGRRHLGPAGAGVFRAPQGELAVRHER